MANNPRKLNAQVDQPLAKKPKTADSYSALHRPVRSPAQSLQRVTSNPESLRPADILQLQRTLGNRTVGALLGRPRVQREELGEEKQRDPIAGKLNGQGSYQPESRSGQLLLAHKLSHVVQQNLHVAAKSHQQHKTDTVTDNELVPNLKHPSNSNTPNIQRATVSKHPSYFPGITKQRPTKVNVKIKDNKVLGKNANSPKKQVEMDMAGWREMSEAFEWNNQECSDYVVKMHLWNGRLGGPGNDARNLVPGKNTENTEMARNIEKHMQRHFKNPACHEMEITSTVKYGHSNDQKNPLYNYPSRIVVKWTSYDKKGKAVSHLSNEKSQELSSPEEKDGEYQLTPGDEHSDDY